MPFRRATSVSDRANNNARVMSTYLRGWPILDCTDFPGGSRTHPGVDLVPRVRLVYAVLFISSVRVWLEECQRLSRESLANVS